MSSKKSTGEKHNSADDIVFREQVATNIRHWLRISRVCNNRCLFCHDSTLQDGVFLGFEELKKQITEARAKGADRLILSGGEPTIHPRFTDLIAEAYAAGFGWVQAISNGRMFAYRDFTERAVKAGLSEVTISIHGPNAAVNDKLTGIKGSFNQAITGLKNLLSTGCLVTVDVVINSENHRYLAEMIRNFYGLGIREFDLLYITPFGRAYDKNRGLLFNLEAGRPSKEAAESLSLAIDTGRGLGCTVWTNRVPPELLEGHEGYIEDPHKITDEVRGRADLFEEMIDGMEMRCREQLRCDLCFVKDLCAALKSDVEAVTDRNIKSAVVGPELVEDEVASFLAGAVAGGGGLTIELSPGSDLKKALRLSEIFKKAGSAEPDIILVEPDVNGVFAEKVGRTFPGSAVFTSDKGSLAALLKTPALPCLMLSGEAADAMALNKKLFSSLKSKHARVKVPSFLLLSESLKGGIDVRHAAGLAKALSASPEGLSKCLGGIPADPTPMRLESLKFVNGRVRVGLTAFAEDFIGRRMMTKSLRCAACALDNECPGIHINHARMWGYGALKPMKR